MARPCRYCPVSMVWQSLRQTKMILAALALLAAAAHGEPATDAVIAEIGAALEKGDAAHALQLADDGLKAQTTLLQRGRLLLDRALAQELLGSHQEALQDFTAALQTRALPPGERAQALLQRGFLFDGLNQLDHAVRDYSAVISLNSGASATALNNRANVYRRQNRLTEAKRDYSAALAQSSDKPQYPYYGLGRIAEAQQDKDAARGFYAKALAADPGYTLAADRLASLGGPSEGALAEPDTIVLRPPGGNPTQAPPGEVPSDGHPVPPHSLAKARPRLPPVGGTGLMLRPALDGPSKGGETEVQLGAWRTEPEAQAGWDKARRRAGEALDGLSAHIVQADLPGKGRYFRLRVATPDPTGLCTSLEAAGQDCARAR
jgi:tetratricopeptide (TPR) repeat protein